MPAGEKATVRGLDETSSSSGRLAVGDELAVPRNTLTDKLLQLEWDKQFYVDDLRHLTECPTSGLPESVTLKALLAWWKGQKFADYLGPVKR